MSNSAVSKLMPQSTADLTIGHKMICAGSAACVADLATFPFDVAKVRLQVTRSGTVSNNLIGSALSSSASKQASTATAGLVGTLMNMAKTEGLASWWNGIIPGLQRQCVFASIRIGLYDNIKDFYASKLGQNNNSTSSVIAIRIMSGITSGAIAISIAQPTDVVKVRMQANSQKAGASGSSLAMYGQIYKHYGLRGLWTGLMPNMARNSLVNATELVCYDSIKQLLLNSAVMNDNLGCHFVAGFSAGFMATLVASPIDVVKTRVMNGSATGVIAAARTLARDNGFFGFYKGFIPSFMRLGTWNICMFVTFEQLKKLSSESKFNFSNLWSRRPSTPVILLDEKKTLKFN